MDIVLKLFGHHMDKDPLAFVMENEDIPSPTNLFWLNKWSLETPKFLENAFFLGENNSKFLVGKGKVAIPI